MFPCHTRMPIKFQNKFECKFKLKLGLQFKLAQERLFWAFSRMKRGAFIKEFDKQYLLKIL